MNQSQLLDRHIQQIETNTSLFKEKFYAISETELNWLPNSDAWSVGLCIEHLITTNQAYYTVFKKLETQSYQPRFYERIPIIPQFFGSIVLKACLPETKRKVKTLQIFEPSSSRIEMTILKRFIDCNEQLISYLEKFKSIDSLDIIVTSPASQFITFPLKTVFEILIYHELRHMDQAERTLKLYREHHVSNVSS